MKSSFRHGGFVSILFAIFCLTSFVRTHSQEPTPSIPDRVDQVYIAGQNGTLQAIPFVSGQTPIKAGELAKNDKSSYVEVSGAQSGPAFSTIDPRIYVFVSDTPNSHPPFLIRFELRKGNRRVTAITERGRAGYAIASDQIVKPHYRVIGKRDGMLFMEIRPREPLMPGEYAIMGSDLSRIATFSISVLK